MQKSAHYTRSPKGVARSNPIILGERAADLAFWGLAAVMSVLIVVATYWLLTHPLV